MKKHNKTIVFLAILIIACIIAIIFILLKKDAPDYAPIDIDPNLVDTGDGSEKLKATKGGGAVALSYDSNVSIDLAKKKVSVQFKNPTKSVQSMTLKVVIENNVIAESGLIPAGYSIYELDLKDSVSLKNGNYKGKFRIEYYDEGSQEKASINTDIPIKITVK